MNQDKIKHNITTKYNSCKYLTMNIKNILIQTFTDNNMYDGIMQLLLDKEMYYFEV